MERALYLLFGAIDVLLIVSFIFVIFRWPILSYLKECLIIAMVCSVESYLDRYIFSISMMDLLIQIASIMLLLRLLMRVNWYHSLSLAAVGAMAYSVVAFVTYRILDLVGVVGSNDVIATAGLGVFTIQAISEACGALIVVLIYKFNLGFSYVSVPPHDQKAKFRPGEKLYLCVQALAILMIISTTYWMVNFGGFGINVIIATELLALSASILLSYRRDFDL